jgi:hypothetical protein
MLVRLLYASRLDTSKQGADAIDSILAQSRSKNPDLGITGVLCHGGGVFMQVLEGGRVPVNALYNKIAGDKRHREVTLLHYQEIAERRFGNWTMGQVNLAKVNPSLLLKYGETAALNPFESSGQATLSLLDELIATALVASRG